MFNGIWHLPFSKRGCMLGLPGQQGPDCLSQLPIEHLSMSTHPDLSATIGHTPLLRLRHASALTGCEVLAKAELLNPGGSIKDRTALGLLRDAEQRGLIRPGGTIVEGTAGNTGIGLALLGASLGYRTVIFMPE